MNRFYTEIIPSAIVMKLKEAGYPQDQLEAPYYADVLDWLIEKNVFLEIFYSVHIVKGYVYGWQMHYGEDYQDCGCNSLYDDWFECVNAGIEKALKLM